MAKRRDYALTVNNETQLDVEQLEGLNYAYLIIGIETSPTTLTPHLQCYVYLKNAITLKSLKKKIPRAHIEPAKGSPQQNRDYCSEDGLYYEYGTLPEQGKRTDLVRLMARIDEGATREDIRTEFPSQYFTYKHRIEELILPTITTKERHAYRLRQEDMFTVSPNVFFADEIPDPKWNGQRVVIVDNTYSHNNEDKILQWINGFPPYYKYGYENRLFDPDIIYIVGHSHKYKIPNLDYKCRDDVQQQEGLNDLEEESRIESESL